MAVLFLLMQTHYELKQYKKGIKAADQILKKFPNHGGGGERGYAG